MWPTLLWGSRQIVVLCVAGALAGAMHAAETTVIDFDAVDDPLAEPPAFLPVGEAFVFSSRLEVGDGGAERLVARWDMPNGYYLYRHGFVVDADRGVTLGEPSIPAGETRTDEYFGESEVYFGSVEVVVPVQARTVAAATVRFGYQGCAEQGFCYPPEVRTTMFLFSEPTPDPDLWRVGILVAGIAALLAVAWARRTMRTHRGMR